jgi:hypothetical protein
VGTELTQGVDATETLFPVDAVTVTDGSEVYVLFVPGDTVLVNATATTHTIPLAETFRKIAGTQVPAVNDGSLVTEVTLPSRDGIVLLRLSHRLYLPLILRT